jgi:hypothetical protein
MLVSNPADPILRVKAGAGFRVWQTQRAPSKVSIVLQWSDLSKGACNTESTMAKHNANSWS